MKKAREIKRENKDTKIRNIGKPKNIISKYFIFIYSAVSSTNTL